MKLNKTNKKLKSTIKKNTLKKSKTNTEPAKSKVSKPNGSLDKVSTQNISIKTDITPTSAKEKI